MKYLEKRKIKKEAEANAIKRQKEFEAFGRWL